MKAEKKHPMDFRKEWSIKANKCLAGKTIVRAFYPSKEALKAADVDEDDPASSALWIELSDGTSWFPMRDDEGNGPGAFACYGCSNETSQAARKAIDDMGGTLPVMF
jgi:hypothetical protein